MCAFTWCVAIVIRSAVMVVGLLMRVIHESSASADELRIFVPFLCKFCDSFRLFSLNNLSLGFCALFTSNLPADNGRQLLFFNWWCYVHCVWPAHDDDSHLRNGASSSRQQHLNECVCLCGVIYVCVCVLCVRRRRHHHHCAFIFFRFYRVRTESPALSEIPKSLFLCECNLMKWFDCHYRKYCANDVQKCWFYEIQVVFHCKSIFLVIKKGKFIWKIQIFTIKISS